MIQIAVTGKPNVGKSTFFSAATLSDVEVASYPFTTIDPNRAVAYVTTQCPCKELGLKCNPRNSKCKNGIRYIPIELIDVAGLVPGAYKGRGLGNKFLDDLRQADMFIHIVDASGSTDEEGKIVEPGTQDPLEDIKFLEKEILMWVYGIIGKNWNKLVRKILLENLKFEEVVYDQLSGIGVSIEGIVKAKNMVGSRFDKWGKEELLKFLKYLINICKPMLIVANKIDIPTAEKNIKKIKNKYSRVVPASAEAELALRKAAKAGLIKYTPGSSNFKIINKDKLNKKQISALNYIKKNILEKYGSTGVQKALNKAVFEILKMIVVYPVENENKMSDSQGNVLPDAILLPKGSTPVDLAYKIHEEIGENFRFAIDARKGIKISNDYKLKNGDIIKIVHTA